MSINSSTNVRVWDAALVRSRFSSPMGVCGLHGGDSKEVEWQQLRGILTFLGEAVVCRSSVVCPWLKNAPSIELNIEDRFFFFLFLFARAAGRLAQQHDVVIRRVLMVVHG